MAVRPIFVPALMGNTLVDRIPVEFEWFPGFSKEQKQRSISSLHENSVKKLGLSSILEISSKSADALGVALSAFNLKRDLEGYASSIESLFQGSKVFVSGGPYVDIYSRSSLDAKRDPRLKTSGKLVEFDFFGERWPLFPRSAFYDWLYISTLLQHRDRLVKLLNYDAFTDIEFNPQKSINCQAYSAALLVSLLRRGLIDADKMLCAKEFLELVSKYEAADSRSSQPSLFD